MASVTREDNKRALEKFPTGSTLATALEQESEIHPQNVELFEKLAIRAFGLLGIPEEMHACQWYWCELQKGINGLASEALSFLQYNVVVGVAAPFETGAFSSKNHVLVTATCTEGSNAIRSIKFTATKTPPTRKTQTDPRSVEITYNDGNTTGKLLVGATTDNQILTYDWQPLRGKAPELQEEVFEAVKDTPLSDFLARVSQANFSEEVFALMTGGFGLVPAMEV